MRWLAAGLLALTIVLAGCSLPSDPDQTGPADSITPADAPEIDTPEPVERTPAPEIEISGPAASRIPIEGITNDSSISPRNLSIAHRDAIENQAIRITRRSNWTTIGVEVRDRRIRSNTTAIFLPDGSYWENETRHTRYLGTESSTNETASVFANESLRLRRLVRGSNVTYTRLGDGAIPNVRLQNTPTFVGQVLSVENVSVERTTWRGEPHYLIDGRGAAGGLYTLTDEYRVRAIVRDDGMVRQLTVNYIESPIGRDRYVNYTITIDPIERDRLDPPGWLTEARSKTGGS
jgi:hypothetical protein